MNHSWVVASDYIVVSLRYAGWSIASWGLFHLVKKYSDWLLSPLRVLPGPNKGFWLGSYPDISKEPFLSPHKRWIQQAAAAADGESTPKMIHYTTFLGRSSVLILDKDIVRQILTAPNKSNYRFRKDLNFIKNVVGDGLVVLEGEQWMRHRKLLQPAFHPETIKAALDLSLIHI